MAWTSRYVDEGAAVVMLPWLLEDGRHELANEEAWVVLCPSRVAVGAVGNLLNSVCGLGATKPKTVPLRKRIEAISAGLGK